MSNKLYGGTKTELERLISDASTYTEEQEKMNMTVDKGSMSFDNIVKAISVVQEHQNIAGTTARESTETIGGSLNMLQAAWQNLVDGFANPDADIGELIDNVMTALVGSTDEAGNHIKGFVDNVLPAIETAVESIASALAERLPEALSTLGSIFAKIAPELLAAATTAVGQVVAALPSILAGIGQVFVDTLSNIDFGSIDLEQKLRDFLVEHFGSTDFGDVAESIGNALKDALSDLGDVIEVGGEIVDGIIQDISEHAPDMIEAATAIITALEEGLGEVSVSTIDVGGNIIASLLEGLQSNGGEIVTAAGEIIVNLCDGLMEAASAAMEAGAEIVTSLSEGFNENATEMAAAAGQMVADLVVGFVEHKQDFYTAAGDLVLALAEGLSSAIPTALQAIAVFAYEAINGILGAAWEATGAKIVEQIKNGLNSAKNAIGNALKTAGENAKNMFQSVSWASVGTKVINLIKSALSSAGSAIGNVLKTAGTTAMNAFKSVNWASAGTNAINLLKGALSSAGSAIGSALKAAGTKAVNAFRGVNWASAGTAAINLLKGAISSAGTAISSTLRSIGNEGMNAFRSIDWGGLGSSIVHGIVAGISAAGGAITSTLVGLAQSALSAAKAALGIHSPSKVFRDEVGKNIVLGLVQGITDNQKEAENAGAGMATALYDSVNEELEIHSPSRKGAKIGANLVKGISKGVKDSEKEAVKKVEETAGKVLDAASKILEHYEISHHNMRMEKRLEIEREYWKKALKHVKHGTDAYYSMLQNYYDAVDELADYRREKAQEKREKALAKQESKLQKLITSPSFVIESVKKSTSAIIKSAKGMYDKLNSAASQWLDNYKVYHSVSLKYEMEYWDKIRLAQKEGTQGRIDADKKYMEAQQKWQEERNKVRQDAQQLTKEYAQKYYDIETARDKKIRDLEESTNEKIEQNNKKLTEALDKADQDLAKKIRDRNQKLQDDIKKLTDEYNKTVDSRVKSIMSMTNLFDKVKYNKTFSKDYLLETLDEQVKALEDWDAELDALGSKLGTDNPLYQSIEDMGVSSLYTLKEINGMTGEELQRYSNMYQKKSDVARARALQENEKLKAQLEEDIQKARDDAAVEIAGYVNDAAILRESLISENVKQNQELQNALNEQRQTIINEAKNQLVELTNTYTENMAQLAEEAKKGGKDVGEEMIAGMEQGIKESQAILAFAAQAAAEQALAAAKAKLGIKSPSKAFKEIGKNVDLGFAEGIEENSSSIKRAIDNIISMPDTVVHSAVDTGTNKMGFVQNLTINSPTALSPWEVQRQTRLANQQMILAMQGV